jgi:hypothetical protein
MKYLILSLVLVNLCWASATPERKQAEREIFKLNKEKILLKARETSAQFYLAVLRIQPTDIPNTEQEKLEIECSFQKKGVNLLRCDVNGNAGADFWGISIDYNVHYNLNRDFPIRWDLVLLKLEVSSA